MEHYRQPGPRHMPATPEFPLLTRDVIESHLELISRLDRNALLGTLVPHQTLPEYDPARYVIEQYERTPFDASERPVNSSYILGVVFGRSLLARAAAQDQSSSYLLPLIGDLDKNKRQLVDNYLLQARYRRARSLTSLDWQLHPDLNRATELFCRRCELVVPDLMLDGADEVIRGAHDYLSVINLLEASHKDERHKLYRRLGVVGVGAAVAYFINRHIGQREP